MPKSKQLSPSFFVVGSTLILIAYFVSVWMYVPSVPSSDPQLQLPLFDIKPMLFFIGFMLAIMAVLVSIFLLHKPKAHSPYAHIKSYVKQARSTGLCDAQIREHMVSSGWKEYQIEEVFSQL